MNSARDMGCAVTPAVTLLPWVWGLGHNAVRPGKSFACHFILDIYSRTYINGLDYCHALDEAFKGIDDSWWLILYFSQTRMGCGR